MLKLQSSSSGHLDSDTPRADKIAPWVQLCVDQPGMMTFAVCNLQFIHATSHSGQSRRLVQQVFVPKVWPN